MFGDRGPSASDPVLHLGDFLVHECDHLPQTLHFPVKKKNLDIHLVGFDFSQLVCFLVFFRVAKVMRDFHITLFSTLPEVRERSRSKKIDLSRSRAIIEIGSSP